MATAISEQDLVAKAPDLIKMVGKQSVFIQKDGETVAVVISAKEYESTREARVQRLFSAMDAVTEAIYSKNPSEEELLELEKALDRKA